MEERGLIESLDFLYTDNREDCERPEFVEKLRRATESLCRLPIKENWHGGLRIAIQIDGAKLAIVDFSES